MLAFYWFMDHKPEVLCWNVRGLNNLGKRKAVRAFVEAVKVNLVCFQETKLHVIDQYDVMQCVRPYFDGFSYLPVSDTRGGVLLAWDSTVLDVDCLVLDTHSITGVCIRGRVTLGGSPESMGHRVMTRSSHSLTS